MANLSSAWGQLTITAPTKEDIAKFIILMNETLKASDYYTCLYIINNINNIDVQDIKTIINMFDFYESNNKIATQISFSGVGRWAYSYNIEHLEDWIKNNIIDFNFDKKKISVLREYFSNSINTIKLKFDYYDEESGCCFLIHKIGTKTFLDKGPNPLNISFEESFDYTRENLVNIAGYDDSELFDYTEDGIFNALDRMIYFKMFATPRLNSDLTIDFIKENIKNIVTFMNKNDIIEDDYEVMWDIETWIDNINIEAFEQYLVSILPEND